MDTDLTKVINKWAMIGRELAVLRNQMARECAFCLTAEKRAKDARNEDIDAERDSCNFCNYTQQLGHSCHTELGPIFYNAVVLRSKIDDFVQLLEKFNGG